MSAIAILVAAATAMPAWTWENPLPHGGSVLAIHGEGSTVWAVGDRGAMLRSVDGGVSWTVAESGTSDSLRAIDGAGPLVIAVGTSGIVLRSRDGVTFEKRAIATSSLVDVAVTPTSVFAIGSDGTVWRSSDTGDSFTTTTTLAHGAPRSIAVAPSGLYVGTTEGLYRSQDEGSTFRRVTAEPVHAIAVRGEEVYALAASTVVYPSLQICGSCIDTTYDVVALYRSRNGTAWVRRTLEGPATHRSWGAPTAPIPPSEPPVGALRGYRGVGSPRIRPWYGGGSLALGPATEVYVSTGTLHVSTDGATFSTRTARGGVLWAGSKVLVATGAGSDLAWSRDRGASWQSVAHSPLPSDVAVGRMTVMPDGRVLAIASSGGLLVRDKGWSMLALPITKHQRIGGLFALDAHHVVAAGDNGLLLQSTDGGRTFEHRATDSTADLGSVWGHGDDVFVAGRDALLHSRDRGRTWESIRGKGYRFGRLWGTSATDLWLLDHAVMHSTDRGSTWRAVSPELGGRFNAMWGRGPRDLFLVGMDGAIRHSRDRGATWTERQRGTAAQLHDIVGHGDHLFAVGSEAHDGGAIVLHSGDGGATWRAERIHANQPLQAVAVTKDSVIVGGGSAILRRKL